jgi:hypothetical protein
MPLTNFGAILNFAADLEAADGEFYKKAAANPAAAQYKSEMEALAAEKAKNEKLMRRTCRESVCEMILEPIVDFARTPFVSDRGDAETMESAGLLEKALHLEGKAEQFYIEAAEKIRALPEVARALARAATRRAADTRRLEELTQK